MADDSHPVGGGSGIANGAIVKYHHVLGTRITAGKSIEHLSDDTVIYVAGRHVAAFSVDNPQHRFIIKNQRTEEIVTFCVSANKKYIALAERMVADSAMQVNVYTQQTGSKVRSLEFKYLSKLPVVSMCFSTDNKHLVTVTSLPDVYIYLWQVDKSRLVGMIDVPFEISRITISPWAHWSLCSTGPSSLKVWRLVEKQLKPVDVLPKRGSGPSGPGGASSTAMVSGSASGGVGSAGGGANSSFNFRFSCHCWYDDEKIAAGTMDGDVLVVENNETKRVMRAVLGDGIAVTAVVPTSRGILVGGDNGFIGILERTTDEGMYFRVHVRFSLGSTVARVIDVSLSPKEDSAVAVTADNNLCLISLDAMEVTSASAVKQQIAGGASSAAAADAGGNANAALLSCATMLSVGFHSDAVTAVDVCVQKSLIVTGSLDKSLRVWNFLRRRVDFVKRFDEEVLSLALHPTGLRIVIGFKSYMRMYNMLANDVHFCTELPVKPCHQVRFSKGGHSFAAVVAHRVLIFNAYDFQCTTQLSGHTVFIRSLCWSTNDLTLTTADVNGVVHCWHAFDGSRKDDGGGGDSLMGTSGDSRRNVAYTCVRSDDSGTGMIAAIGAVRIAEAGSAEGELLLRCLVPGQEPRTVRPGWVRTVAANTRKHHTCELALSTQAQTLFVGTPSGSVALYRWPLQDDAQPYQVIEAHNGEVTFLLLSVDERYLFSIGDDSCMYMYEVDAIQDGRSVARKPFNYAAFEDVCYVLQSELDDKARDVNMFKQQLEELAIAKAREEANIIAKYELERSSKDDDFNSRLDFLKKQLDQVSRQKGDAEHQLVENAKQLEAMHLKAAEELEGLYAKRSDEANARYASLKTERDDLIVRYESKVFAMTKDHDAEKRRAEERLRDMEQRLSAEIEVLQKRLADNQRAADAILDQTIADYEVNMDEAAAKFKGELAKTEEDLGRAINSSSTGERDAERLKKEKLQLTAQLHEKERYIVELQQIVDKKVKENESLKKEMGVRFESISTAEKKIQQLKKQTTELDKLRYVLTFKFNELKKEVAPKDKQIQMMGTRVEEMDLELERVAVDREGLKQTVDRREHKLATLQRELAAHRTHLEDKARLMSLMLHELEELAARGEEKRLVFQLKDVIAKYTAKQRAQGEAQGGGSEEHRIAADDRTAEFERHREYMESQLTCLERQAKQKESNMRQETQRGTVENAILVKEVNDLRHEKKQLLTRCTLVESQLREARLALHRAVSVEEQAERAGGVTSANSGGSGTGGGGASGASRSSSAVPPIHRKSPDAGGAAAPPLNVSVGRLIRGPTRSLRDVGQLDADKIARIIAQVERNNEEMTRQQAEIERLREFLAHLLSRGSDASGATTFTPEELARRAEIQQHLTGASPSPNAGGSRPGGATGMPALPAAGSAVNLVARPPSNAGRR